MPAELTELVQVKVLPETKVMLEEWASADGERTVASIIRRLIENERVRRMRQRELPLAAEEVLPAEQVRRLKVQELPGFIPNELIGPHPRAALPRVSLPQGEREGKSHLGTGPGDDVDEEGADGDL